MINQYKLKQLSEPEREKILKKKGDKKVHIHSNRGMWRPDAKGYTEKNEEAWELTLREAYKQTEHCGAEKNVTYHYVVEIPEVFPLSNDEKFMNAAELGIIPDMKFED